VNALFNEAAKSKAKKAKWEERKKEIEDNENGFTGIKNLKKLTSGQMTANNHYHVTDDEVYEYIQRKQEEIQMKQSAITEKQSEIEKKKQREWILAYRKWDNDETLFSKDYKVLLKSMLMDDDVLPKNVSGLKSMFYQPEYQERLMEMGCEVPGSDDESTSTCYSDISTGTCTSDTYTPLNNGEDCVEVLQDDSLVNQSEKDQNIPEEEDTITVKTAKLVRNIRYKEIDNSHPAELNRVPSDFTERDQDLPGAEDEQDEKSVMTAVLVHSIKYSAANIRRIVESTTGNDSSQYSEGVMFREETSESTVARLLAGMRSDTVLYTS
jgi:hypothetical protein